MKNLIHYYESQIEIHEGIIEKYQESSNPDHVRFVAASRLAIRRYQAKIAALQGGVQ